jgi:hypothetical protein
MGGLVGLLCAWQVQATSDKANVIERRF